MALIGGLIAFNVALLLFPECTTPHVFCNTYHCFQVSSVGLTALSKGVCAKVLKVRIHNHRSMQVL